MGKGPGFFDSIGKGTKDLLYKDYTYDNKITLTTVTETGVSFTTSTTKKGDAVLADLKTKLSLPGGAHTEVTIDAKQQIAVKTTYENIAPALKVIFSGTIPDKNSGKFAFDYAHEYCGLKGSIGLTASPVAELSAAFGQQGLAFGGEVAYDTASSQLTKYTGGVGFTQRDFNVSAILADKGDLIKLAYLHQVDLRTEVGVEVTHALQKGETTFTAGAAYQLDPLTATKARFNNHGAVAALIQHEWRPKSTVTISGEVDTKNLDRSAKVGLALALKL